MKDFLHVFSFYLQKQIRSKMFIGVTLFLCIVSSISMLVVPKLLSNEIDSTTYLVNQCDQLNDIVNSAEFKSICKESLNIDFSMINSKYSNSEIEKKAKDDELDLIYLYGNSQITMEICGDVSMSVSNTLQSVLSKMLQFQSMETLGIDRDTLQKTIPQINITSAEEKKDDSKFIIIIILSLIIVTFIIMYSTSATNEVAYLKTNRVMEMLLTSTQSIPLYLGINLAYAIVPFIQISLISLCVLLIKRILYTGANAGINIDFSVLTSTHICVFIIFLVLGYFVYSLINTALVSMVSKAEDIVGISVPISFIGLIQYFVGIMAMTENNLAVKIFSYIPFTSPTVMFIRFVVGFASVYKVLIAITILLVTIYLLFRWGARVFTTGIIYYSFTGGIKQLMKKVKKGN